MDEGCRDLLGVAGQAADQVGEASEWWLQVDEFAVDAAEVGQGKVEVLKALLAGLAEVKVGQGVNEAVAVVVAFEQAGGDQRGGAGVVEVLGGELVGVAVDEKVLSAQGVEVWEAAAIGAVEEGEEVQGA